MSIPVIDRRAFIGRWVGRSREAGDPFDAFFALWIALAIRARPELRPEDHALDDTDRKAVLRLSESRRDEIFREIDLCQADLAWLSGRRGTMRSDAIVDVHDYCRNRDHLRDRFRRLAEHYAGTRLAKPGLIVGAVIELLNHVRNNLFHGIKDPDDVDDRELVTHLGAVLQAVLRGAGQ